MEARAMQRQQQRIIGANLLRVVQERAIFSTEKCKVRRRRISLAVYAGVILCFEASHEKIMKTNFFFSQEIFVFPVKA